MLILLLFLLQACSIAAPPEPPTSTPAPTDTAAPTPTPPPTLVPTSTPDSTATAASQATDETGAILSELDKLLGNTDIPYQAGHLEWKQEKPLLVTLSGPGWDYVEVDDDLVVKTFILKSDVTWEASGILLCGVIFRLLISRSAFNVIRTVYGRIT